jgi:hypothetical protein
VPELRCEAVRWVDDEPFPGIVEVQFADAAGQRWSLIDKTAIFTRSAELAPSSDYPVEVTVACVPLGSADRLADDEPVTVSLTPDGVTTPDGQDTFTVNRSQLIP